VTVSDIGGRRIFRCADARGRRKALRAFDFDQSGLAPGRRKVEASPVGGFGAMIICSCNVLSDQDVRSVVAAPDSPRTAAQVHRCLGCSPECGRCAPTIRQIVAAAAPRDGAQR
jgi:bacterioferritin-associated ferredoxin